MTLEQVFLGLIALGVLVNMRSAREGMAIAKGIKAAFGAFRDSHSRPRPRGGPVPRAVPDPGDDDHASFIG